MVNKKMMKKKNRGETRELICIPKTCQKRRSHASKRRTDFSPFFSNSSSPPHHQSFQGCFKFELSGNKDNSSSITTSTIDGHCQTPLSIVEEMPKFGLEACANSGDATILLSSPNKSTSQVTDCSDVQATTRTIMWARTSHQIWWPAKIVEGRSAPVSTNDQGACGHVLVQYFGNDELAWVDPVGDLSEFDECFEERSCNPMEAFQDALKQL